MSGAYRDAGAAIERADALEREVEELRAELARVREEAGRRMPKAVVEPPANVAQLKSQLVDVRAENELLRSQLAKSGDAPERLARVERELAKIAVERDELAFRLRDQSAAATASAAVLVERNDLRTQVRELRGEIERLQGEIASAKSAAPPSDDYVDNRDAVIKRLIEERDELLERLRGR